MRTMRTTRMGSARPITDIQSQPHPQPQSQPSHDVLPAEDEALPITVSRELLTHSRLSEQSEYPNPTAQLTTEAFHSLQRNERPQGYRVASQSGADQPGDQQAAVGQTSAFATVQHSSAYMPLLSMQTNNPNPSANPEPNSKGPQMQAQQQPMQLPPFPSKYPLGTAMPLGGKPHGMLYGSIPATKSHDDVGSRERVADNALVVNICDRKVKLTSDWDDSSLYSLCRRWVRNDVSRKDQIKSCHGMIPIPKPLPRIATGNKENEHQTDFCKTELQAHAKSLTEAELLQHHVENFKNVRKRAREHRLDRIARFKPRLCLLFPSV